MNIKALTDGGVDYEKGLKRMMGDIEFYTMVLQAFLDDPVYKRAKEAVHAKDYGALFKCAHEMKGASGNAEMPLLYDASCELTELLRGGAADEGKIAKSFDRFEKAYIKAKNAVHKACTE